MQNPKDWCPPSVYADFAEGLVRAKHGDGIEDQISHFRKVAVIGTAIAGHMGLRREDYADAFAIHDIGKLMVPTKILTKHEQLNDEEWDKVKQHPELGFFIVEMAFRNHPGLQMLKDAVLYHHERWDGDGYPFGISGTDIPTVARIVAVADALDVILYGRGYSRPRTLREARIEISRCSGKQFDPNVVDHFLDLTQSHRKILASPYTFEAVLRHEIFV